MLAANQSLFMLLLNQVYVVGADNGQCMKYRKQQRRCHKLGNSLIRGTAGLVGAFSCLVKEQQGVLIHDDCHKRGTCRLL